MNKKRTYLLALVIVLLIQVSGYAYEWDKGIESFTLGMTIEEIDNVLYRSHPSMKGVNAHNCVNFYFINGQYYKDDVLYANDADLHITQTSDSVKKYAEGKVILKKIFGYKLGKSKWMNGNIVYGGNNGVLLKSKNRKDYYPQMTYHYRFFPVHKINSLVDSVELSFYDDRLIRVLYETELTYHQYSMLLKHLAGKYSKAPETANGAANRFLDGTMGETEIKVTEIARQKKEPELNSVTDFYDLVNKLYGQQINEHKYKIKITYTDMQALSGYQRYMTAIKKKVEELIDKAKHSELKQF